MRPLVIYRRVSTADQGKSGLGADAQLEQLTRFAEFEEFEIVADFLEQESGKGSNALERRPQLRAAFAEAARRKCPIAVAKLDRLARNLHFITGLLESKVDFIAADLGIGASKIMKHLCAMFAEWERDMISARTRDGLAAARRQGKKLGNPKQATKNTQEARQRAEQLRDAFLPLAEIPASHAALRLNERHIPTPTGALWSAQTVIRVRERLKKIDAIA